MSSGNGVWQGMTIKDILEKVDLFNITTVDEDWKNPDEKDKEFKANFCGTSNYQKNEDGKTVIQVSDPTSAYLGPKLWPRENTISLPDLETDVDDYGGEVINMDRFLEENNLLVNTEEEPMVVVVEDPVVSPPHMWEEEQVASPAVDIKENKIQPILQRPSIFAHTSGLKSEPAKNKREEDDEKSFLYVESKRARMEREKEERRRKFEEEISFPPEDLALATVPGRDFDPRNRAFDLEELRPQPIIRKRKKTAVPEELKDEKYWDKRTKNKMATRRSREARRLKENQIALRAAYLEKENKALKKQVEEAQFETVKLRNETDILKQKLLMYEGAL